MFRLEIRSAFRTPPNKNSAEHPPPLLALDNVSLGLFDQCNKQHLFSAVVYSKGTCSLRSRRDRSRPQSFVLVEEKKPHREWGGDALKSATQARGLGLQCSAVSSSLCEAVCRRKFAVSCATVFWLVTPGSSPDERGVTSQKTAKTRNLATSS